MSLARAAQILKILAGYVRTEGITANGSSVDITSDITTTLATAGFEGNPVAVTPSPDVASPGIIVTPGFNRIEIYDNTTKEKFTELSNEVYGRLTEAAGVYTLSFFYLDGGSETVYAFTAPTDIDIEFGYRFKLGDLPTDIFIGLTVRNVQQDAGGGGGSTNIKAELLNVTGTNNIADLSFTPDPLSNVTLFVNGIEESQVGATPSFTTSGKQIIWNSSNAGYDVETTDRVVAKYTSNES